MDKGYKVLQEILSALHRINQRPHSPALTGEELQHNRDIAIEPVRVETYFGRLQQNWNIAKDCYCQSETDYDTQVAIFVCTTNYYVTLHQLPNIDGDFYCRWLKVIRQESIEQREKKLRKRRRSAQKFKLRRISTPERRLKQKDETEDLNDIAANRMQSRYRKYSFGILVIHCNISSDTESSRATGGRSCDIMDLDGSPSSLKNDEDDAIYRRFADGDVSSQIGRRLVRGNDGEYHNDSRRNSVDEVNEVDGCRRVDRADRDDGRLVD